MAEKEYIEREALKRCRFIQDELGEWILAEDIISLPTADVRENKRGKWIKTKEQEDKMFTRIIWKCSVCGIEVINTEPVYRIDDWHFCPNCGADMREE